MVICSPSQKSIQQKVASWTAVIIFACSAGVCLKPVLASEEMSLENAMTLYKQGKFSDAADQLSACLNKEHDNATLHYYLANCYAQQHKKDDALREYRIAYALQPDSSIGRLSKEARERLEAASNSGEAFSNTTDLVAQRLTVPFKATKIGKITSQLFLDSKLPGSRKILFIGNSLITTNQLPLVLAALVINSNTAPEIRVGQVAQESSTLQSSYTENEAVQIIKNEGPWTDIVLQEQSQFPITAPARMIQYAQNFAGKSQSIGAKTVLLETWSNKNRFADQPKIDEVYQSCARTIGASLAPAGEAFERCRVQRADLQLYTDDRHPTPAGTYLAACVLYTTIFHRTPVGLPDDLTITDPISHRRFPLLKIRKADAEALQKIAFESAKAPGTKNLAVTTGKATSSAPGNRTTVTSVSAVASKTQAVDDFNENDLDSLPADCAALDEKIKQAQGQGVGAKNFLNAMETIDPIVKDGGRSVALKIKVHKLMVALEHQLNQSKILQTQPPLISTQPTVASPRGLVTGSSKINYTDYIKAAQVSIMNAWLPPKPSIHVTYRFKINANGSIADINLVDSTGTSKDNDAAKRAIQSRSPLPALPGGVDEFITIETRFERFSSSAPH